MKSLIVIVFDTDRAMDSWRHNNVMLSSKATMYSRPLTIHTEDFTIIGVVIQDVSDCDKLKGMQPSALIFDDSFNPHPRGDYIRDLIRAIVSR